MTAFSHTVPTPWVPTQIVSSCGLFYKGQEKGTLPPMPPLFGDQPQKPVPVSFKPQLGLLTLIGI